jgi:hypothetical protein
MQILIQPTKINADPDPKHCLKENLSYYAAEHLADILVTTHERKVRLEIGKKSKKVTSVKVKKMMSVYHAAVSFWASRSVIISMDQDPSIKKQEN